MTFKICKPLQFLLLVIVLFHRSGFCLANETAEYYEEPSTLDISEPSNVTTLYPDDVEDSQHWEHGIHVASIKFGYVKQPLIVAIFMIIVVLCKLGDFQIKNIDKIKGL